MNKAGIQEVSNCLLCGQEGEILYADIRDFLFDNDGVFSFLHCPSCGLIWLSPRPAPDAMGRFYGNYYTHTLSTEEESAAVHKRFLGELRNRLRESILCGYYGYRHIHMSHRICGIGRYLGRIPFLRERAANELRARLPFYIKGGRVIDVGCGRGDFLFRMKELGWEVLGIETDPLAAEIAKRRGIPVDTMQLEKTCLPENWADAVIMNHVIEHIYDPVSELKECRRLLKKGGRLVLYTPNALSLGHETFGRSWRGLEPPRHLHVFSPATIRSALVMAGFTDVKVRTPARIASGIFNASKVISREGNLKCREAPRQKGASVFALKESFFCALGLPKGEEIEVVAFKRK